MKLFVEKDVQATPMSAIAKAAKTGMGTIYNYFATKEELINAIFIYIKEDQQQQVTKNPTTVSVKKEFEHYYLGFSKYWIEHSLYFYFVDHFEGSPIITGETRKQGMSIIQPITELLLQGQQQGEIKSIGIDELVNFLNGGIHGFVRWVLISEKKQTGELLQNQLKLAWDAIKN